MNYSSKSLKNLNLYLCTIKSDLQKKKGSGVFDVKFYLENLKEDNCKHSFFVVFQVRLLLLTGSGMPQKWGTSNSMVPVEGEEDSRFMSF